MSVPEQHPNTKNYPAGVGQPAIRAFAREGLSSFEQFAGLSEQSVRSLHGVGPKAIRTIKEALAEAGLEPMAP